VPRLVRAPAVLLVVLLAAAWTPRIAAAACDLRVSASGHTLEALDGTPFLFLSDTEWVLNTHPDADVLALLDDRKARGYTVVQVFATRHWDGAYAWAQTDSNGNVPFVNDDVTQLNTAYWDRWAWIIDRAQERGLFLLLIMGEPGRLEEPWLAHSDAEGYAYGRAVGAHLASKTSLIFCNGQDSSATGGIGPSGWRAIAEGVADGVNGVDRFDGAADYSTTLMTYHGYNISSTFHADDWIDFYGPEVWHDNAAVYAQISGDYALTGPTRPTAFLEGSYEGEEAFITPRYVRVEAWHTFFAGGAGYAFGNAQNWQQADNIDYLTSPGNQQMTVLAGFIRGRALGRLVPDQGIIASGESGGATRKVAARSADGDACWVFFPEPQAATIRLDCVTAASEAAASWFDPRDATVTSAGSYATTGVAEFTPPADWEDAVLVLETSVDAGGAEDGGPADGAPPDGSAEDAPGVGDAASPADGGTVDGRTGADGAAAGHGVSGGCGCRASGDQASRGVLPLVLGLVLTRRSRRRRS